MDLDLLHLENKAYNSSFALLDWQLISESILKYVHLACQKEQGLHSIIGASPDNFSFKQRQHIINQYYSFLEFLLNVVFPNNEGEMVQCLQALPNDEDLEVLLSHLDKGGQLSIEELNFVAILIENGSDLFKLFNNSPQLECFRFSDNFFKDLFKRFLLPFRRLVDTDGNIDYSRHSTLGPLYNEVISLEGRLRDYLNTLANNSSLSNKLQFKGHDIINDYYVLAIKSDSYHSSIGRIRARSETGQTLYVEPHGAKELSRQRIELLARIDAEISRIGREFAKSLKEAVPQLKILWQFICEIDIQNAKARYIREKQLTKPTFSDNSNWEMIDFFHPLIPNPIVNSIKLTNHDGLIISGPNTGGKTVALKALALSQLFIHYGLFTPCTHAKLPIYTSLFYLGNDQQAIDKGLSSFSSEVINYHYVLENLTNSNLIIIDEIFNSTSSEEASALALGLFEEIHRRSNATILVSTHHQMLKTIMHKNKNYLSAHVGFDLEAQLPTFKLHLDTPGSSLALTIFKRLCKDLFNVDKILTKAQNTLDTRTLTYEKLLQELSQKESKLDKLISENAQLQKEL
ncbi:MAG: MutS-related protein, partial [bacterium]